MDTDDNVMDPEENPVGTGHLPAAGEVGNGPVSYHDPVTQATNDDVAETDEAVTEEADQPSPDEGGAAGLS